MAIFYYDRSFLPLLFAGAVLGFNGVATLCAEDNQWSPATRNNKDWLTPGLWSLGRVPTLQDRVFIEKGYRGSSFTRTELSGANGYAGELQISGGSSSNGPSLYISNAKLEIGTLLALGDRQSSSGSFLVEGAGASVIGAAGARLMVGGVGSGTFEVDLGAKARFDGGITIGRDVSSSGYLSLYDTAYPSRSRTVLETAFIERGSTSSSSVALRVHGGMIRATEDQDRFFRNLTEGTISIGNNHFHFDTNGFNVTIADGTHFEGVGAFNKVGGGALTLGVTSRHDYGYNFSGGVTYFKGGVHEGRWAGLVLGTSSGVETSVVIEEQAVFHYRDIGLGLYSGQHGDLTIRDRSEVNLTVISGLTSPMVTVGGQGDAHLGLESGARLNVYDSSGSNGLGWVALARLAGSRATLDFGASDLDAPTTTGFLMAERIEFGEGTGRIRFNQTDELTLDADIVGEGRVEQRGNGRTTITGTVGADVETFVTQGTFVADGEFENSISLQQGRLEGTGSIHTVYLHGGTLAPGHSPGAMEIGYLEWVDGVIEFDLGRSPDESDFLQIAELGLLGSASTYQWAFKNNGWQVGDTYALFTLGTGVLDPSRFSFTNDAGFDGEFFFEGDTLQFTLHAIPEPGVGVLLLAGGVFGLTYRSWRRLGQL